MDENDLKAFALAFDKALEYRKNVRERSPVPAIDPEPLREAFGGAFPEQGGNGPEIIQELVENADPGLLGITGPRMFAWVKGASHPTGVAADWITAMWGQNVANYFCSPAGAVAEEVAGSWLLELLDLDRNSSVGFVTGATMANFTGILAGRHRVLADHGWDVEAKGLFGAPEITVIISEEAHATAYAALQYAGLGRDRVTKIPAGPNACIDPEKTIAALETLEGPIILVLQAGQINSGDFDSFQKIVPFAKSKGAWVHVDGAFGLWARACPSLRAMTNGVELCDSFAVDGHKWLQTPYDCGYAFCRDEEAHRSALSIAASYLPVDVFRDPSHYVPELSRRARGFATWAMIKRLGRAGIVTMVETHVRLAQKFAALLDAEDGVEVLNEVVLNQFVVRFGDDDDLTNAVIEKVLEDGTCFLRGALWQGKAIMRISVISGGTKDEDIEASADAILKAWEKVKST